jgi:LasA protease
LTIEHADGWRTGYYHIEDVRPRNGEQVRTGELLGRIGNATPCGGSSTGAHVHFSLWQEVGEPDGGGRLAAADLTGRLIGGWLVQPVAGQYAGRLTDVLAHRVVVLPGDFTP